MKTLIHILIAFTLVALIFLVTCIPKLISLLWFWGEAVKDGDECSDYWERVKSVAANIVGTDSIITRPRFKC